MNCSRDSAAGEMITQSGVDFCTGDAPGTRVHYCTHTLLFPAGALMHYYTDLQSQFTLRRARAKLLL